MKVFGKPKQRSGWNTAVRAVARRGDAALLRVDDALALVEAAGLEAEQVWPEVDLIDVYSNLFESTVVRGEDGKAVLDAEGMPTYELTPRRVPVGIVGFDIGITLPKSASLLLAFLPDELIDRVEAGYTDAIERTFGWVEDRTSYVRRGKHGDGHTARVEQSSGFSGWVMTHRAARPVGEAVVGDPHWHVHITIANMAKAPDGTWLTVAAGGRDLMRHAPAIDKVTQAQVRAGLHRELGITFTRSARTGVWEEAKELARQAADLQKELGGPKVWRLAREQAERAEARYPDDRREAQHADEADLTRTQDRVARLDRVAAEAGTRRDELIAEQQLREAMPQSHRIAETVWRIHETRQDLTRQLEHLAEHEPEPDLAPPEVDLEMDYHERTMDRGIDIDQSGPSLGL